MSIEIALEIERLRLLVAAKGVYEPEQAVGRFTDFLLLCRASPA